MKTMDVKHIDARLQEAIEVKDKLSKCGVLLNPELNDIFVEKTNAFVRDGRSCAFWLREKDGTVSARVSLNARIDGKSGVVLEMG